MQCAFNYGSLMRLKAIWMVIVLGVLPVCTSCATSSKQLKVLVTDQETKAPIPGVEITTDYLVWPWIAKRSVKSSRATTDERGIALLSVNLRPEKRMLFGFLKISQLSPSFSFYISNSVYETHHGTGWHANSNLLARPATFVPEIPDLEESIVSQAELQRLRLQRLQDERERQAAIDKKIRENPDYWPDMTWSEKSRPSASDNAYFDRRWELASTNMMGNLADLSEIKKLFTTRPSMKVREIRWVSPTTVIAEISTDSVGYYCLVRKEGEQWRIIARKLLWIV